MLANHRDLKIFTPDLGWSQGKSKPTRKIHQFYPFPASVYHFLVSLTEINVNRLRLFVSLSLNYLHQQCGQVSPPFDPSFHNCSHNLRFCFFIVASSDVRMKSRFTPLSLIGICIGFAFWQVTFKVTRFTQRCFLIVAFWHVPLINYKGIWQTKLIYK